MIDRRRFLCTAGAAAAALLLPRRLAASTPDARGLDAVVARLRGFVEDAALPFAAIRIARHGRVLAEAHVGGVEPVGPDTLYRIYSMTKPVVAAGAMLLVEDGRLSLNDPVARHVPEFAKLAVEDAGVSVPARSMTVAHLLTHSCGLANSWGGSPLAPRYREAGLVAAAWMYDPEIGGLDGFAARLGALPLAFQPGSDWLYGYGLDIAGLVIERLAGERLGAFLRRRLFEPLGMASTGFSVPATRAADLAGLYHARAGGPVAVSDGSQRLPLRQPLADGGSAGLVSTMEDYGRFADMLANGGERAGTRVMGAATVRRLMAPFRPQAPLQDSLLAFGRYRPGSVAQALGGIVRLDDRDGPGSRGEYGWGGAAGTGFFAAPALGLSMTLMTQLMPVAAPSARDALRPMVYAALAESRSGLRSTPRMRPPARHPSV